MKRPLLYSLLALGLIATVVWSRLQDAATLTWMAYILLVPAFLMLGRRPKLGAAADRINGMSVGARRWTALGIGLASVVYFAVVTYACNRPFFPVIHDEQMHAVQIRLLSTGRLWTKSHPMADFFDTFHVMMHPVYAPMHFPGTALLNVAKVWLRLPWPTIPLILISGGCVLTFLIISELSTNVVGLIAALLFWSSPVTRVLSTMVISHNCFLCLAPLSVWFYLRWREKRLTRWALLVGTTIGWMAITRPVDAIAFALPIGIAVLIDAGRSGWRPVVAATLLMSLPTVPFLTLELIFDKAITGSYLTAPYRYYNDTAYPMTSYAGPRPPEEGHIPHVSDLPQKQEYYEDFMFAAARYYQHEPAWAVAEDRFGAIYQSTLPSPLLILLLPLGLYAATRSLARFVVIAPAVLMPLLYLPNIFYPAIYAGMAMVSMVAAVLFGAFDLGEAFASRPKVRRFAVATVGMAAVLSVPPFSLMHTEDYSMDDFPVVRTLRTTLPYQVQKPALVLFKYPRKSDYHNFHDEPVYNYDTVNPDDAQITLAQSLGPRNFELIHYYHGLGQNRYVYEFDRRVRRLYYVGRIEDLDKNRPTTAITTAATGPATSPATTAATRP